jgi:serine/threonine-protein kinase
MDERSQPADGVGARPMPPGAGAPTDTVLDGKYRLEHELARGGMGRVHVATHVHLGTRVAIKVLHDPGAPDDDAANEHARFLQEARAAAQLRHPNVVQVLDFGIDAGRPYLVMELLDGETLRARLDRGPIDAATTAAIVTAIAAALTAAHAAGIVHRDLKPDNVFLIAAATGLVAKVLDFGVAKLAASPSAVTTASGAVLGTPAYMSPEQAQGADDVDAASDRWALGVIAYECLVGRRPFVADSLGELVLQICAWAPPVPSRHADVPAGFDRWFATACARDRAARFGSAAAQATALARLCAGDIATGNTLKAATAPHTRNAQAVDPGRAPAPARPGRAAPMLAALGAGGLAVALAWSRPWQAAPAPNTAAITAPIAAPITTPIAAPITAPLRIAVLPVEATADADLATLADAATEELIARLAGRPGLRVIARASVMRRRGLATADLAHTAAELGADRLLIGHMTRTAAGVRIALELIDPRDQTVAWTRTYTRPDTELESVCALAASDLAIELGAPRTSAPAPRAPAAYRAYRTGRAYWARRDQADLLKAIGYFEDALRVDPDYAAAYVGLVDAYLLLPWMGTTPRAVAYQKAEAALDRALALAPDSADVQAARGNYELEADWRFDRAEQAYRRAIELDPDNADAHQWLGETLAFAGRFDDALAEFDLAIQLDPLVPASHKVRGRTLYYAGRFADAITALDRSLALDPASPFARYIKGYALVQLGHFDAGLAEIKGDPMMTGPGLDPILAVQDLWVASRRGDGAAVARLRAVIAHSNLADLSPFTAAFAAAIVDDRAAVFANLQRAIAEHDPWTPFIAINHQFDPYRADPRFAALIAQLHM